jgi:hypothetical protein
MDTAPPRPLALARRLHHRAQQDSSAPRGLSTSIPLRTSHTPSAQAGATIAAREHHQNASPTSPHHQRSPIRRRSRPRRHRTPARSVASTPRPSRSVDSGLGGSVPTPAPGGRLVGRCPPWGSRASRWPVGRCRAGRTKRVSGARWARAGRLRQRRSPHDRALAADRESGLVETEPYPVRPRPGANGSRYVLDAGLSTRARFGWRVGVVAARGMVEWAEACEGASGSAGRTEFTSRFVVAVMTISEPGARTTGRGRGCHAGSS